ncbi:sigma 54-interacting transcriptional regulator [Methylohalobius crimeensis]|uniref:sigma 54-interacting transcriptional regulator n=1 Tax=Methylohalobius crimeensis TaxID=244365 RepID=UPI0003B6D3CC|nr:sigma 54-interacting transcriptional regulator [Methylohalobius crimeensis]
MDKQENHAALIELESLLRFESLLAELSARFVRVSLEDVDAEIQESLRRIAETLDLDHIGIGEVTPDGRDFFSIYHYAKPGTKPWLGVSLSAEGPLLTRTLLAGKAFVMNDVDALPPEGATDREGFLRYGIRADLVFPLIVGGCLCGGIGFASSRPRDWSDKVVQGLRLISDVFANVLERKRADHALRESEEHMRLAAEAAEIGLWVWYIPQNTIWASDRARVIYGFSPGDRLNLQRFLDRLVPEDRERVREAIRKTLQDGGTYRIEYRVAHPDAGVRWLCATGRCQLDAGGRPERLMGAGLDVTGLRRAKSDLERSNAELKRALEKIGSLKEQLQQENVYLRREMAGRRSVDAIVGRSAAIRRTLAQIEQVAPTPATVLITGETGTGKELFATAIHEASPRSDRPMIRVNCASIPAALIESELFGREKGAYTGALAKQIGRFELADGSTLFLDEVGELSLEAQAKLLRVLQEKEIERLGNPRPIKVDVRVIAATNRNLSEEVAERRFREDLYYRLNVFPIDAPPLRARREDIPLLVETFVDEFARAMGKSIDAVAKSSLQALCGYDWPGNIRELRNVIERAVILARGPVLRIDLPPKASSAAALPAKAGLASLAEMERDHIVRVLDATGWRIRGEAGAAAILGLKPSTLDSRMVKLGIRRPSCR